VVSRDGKRVYVTGHSEYDSDTLGKEYQRDRSKGLSDITALGYGYRYEYKKMQTISGFAFSNRADINVYLRYSAESDLEFFRLQKSLLISEKIDVHKAA
jgi:homoserine O-succinyltransferase